MASLMAVTVMMKIRGREFSAALTVPKIGNICDGDCERYLGASIGATSSTYHKDNNEQEEDVGNVLELEPEVLRDEGQGRVLGRPDLVSRVRLRWVAVLVEHFFWQREVEEQPPRRRAVRLVLRRLFFLPQHSIFLSDGSRAARLSLLLRRRRLVAYPVHDGQPFQARAPDRQPPSCPSRPLRGLAPLALGLLLLRHHAAVAGRARSTPLQCAPEWPWSAESLHGENLAA